MMFDPAMGGVVRSVNSVLGSMCLLAFLWAVPACTTAGRVAAGGDFTVPYEVLADEEFSRDRPAWQAELKPFLRRLERYYEEQAGLRLVFKGYGRWKARACALDLPPQYCPFFRRQQCTETLALAFAGAAEGEDAYGLAIPLCGRVYFGPAAFQSLTVGAESKRVASATTDRPPEGGPSVEGLAYQLVGRALGAVSEPGARSLGSQAGDAATVKSPPALGPVSRRLLRRIWRRPLGLRERLALADKELASSLGRETPPYPQMLRDYGELLYWRGSDALAEKVFRGLIRTEGDKPEYRGRLAELLQRQGKLREALVQYEAAARWYEERQAGEEGRSWRSRLLPIYANQGSCFTELGNLDAAAESFGKALSLSPEFVEALYGMGYVSTLRGDQQAALGYYHGAVKRMPDHRFALNGRAATLLQLQRYEEALIAFREMLALYPQDAEALYGLGVVFHQMDDKAQALENYKKSLEIKPDYAECMNNLAQIYLTGGQGVRPDEHRALKLAQRAVTLSGGVNPQIWDTLALVLAQMKKYEGALAASRRALSLDPTSRRLRSRWEEIQKKFLTDPDFGDSAF